MAALQSSYQALISISDNDAGTPQENIMFHTDSRKTRWNHVEDLDSFFTRVYSYHQKNGFATMMLQEVLELFQFIFVVLFATFLLQCVDYAVLFKDHMPHANMTREDKITFGDAVIPIGKCAKNLNSTIILCLLVATLFWLLRLVRVVYHFFQFWEIREFYITALRISPNDLDSMTWHEVQCKLLEVQKEQQMCIHKQELSELDIYHRILRFKNYVIAMVNKNVLPLKFNLPFFGEIAYLPTGLKYNLEFILFWGPWAPFRNNWNLREDYKKVGKRKELAEQLSKHILWVGIANFLLCPLVLLWQVLYSFFSYAEIIKREPTFLGARRWSHYGRLFLRHFNELDHELNSRLNRSYRPASQYMSIFTSPLVTVIAKNVAFCVGSLLAVLILLAVYDEDVLTVQHAVTTAAVLGAILGVCRACIPDENLVWCPERLMQNALAHIHYMPDHWRGNAHTFRVRDEFAQLFQYKLTFLVEELLSPITTPFILCFHLRHRTLDVVDFFRNFSLEVVGVGDVCSFAQMDIRRHGNPQWMTEGQTDADQYQQAEYGKTELSLMHFTVTNPNWVPPNESTFFLKNIRDHAQMDAGKLHSIQEDNPLFYSLHSLSSLGGGYADFANSLLHVGQTVLPGASSLSASAAGNDRIDSPQSRAFRSGVAVRGGLSRAEGPLFPCEDNPSGLLYSLHPVLPSSDELSPSLTPVADDVSLEATATNMSLSTLYMHELHSRQLRKRRIADTHARMIWQRPLQDMPGILESPQEAEEQGEQQPLLTDSRMARSS